MLLALLAPKDLFPVCCLLCLLPKTYFQYAVGFACSQRLISSMLLALLAPKDLLPVCCLLWLLPKTYFQYAVYFDCSQRLICSMLLALLALKDLFPICCLLWLLPKTYLAYQSTCGALLIRYVRVYSADDKELPDREIKNVLQLYMYTYTIYFLHKTGQIFHWFHIQCNIILNIQQYPNDMIHVHV